MPAISMNTNPYPSRATLTISAEVLELLALEVEDSRLIVLFGRGKVERVAEAAVHGQPIAHRHVSWTKYSWKLSSGRA
ncbi:MAG TPA: hypothetical protein VFT47_13750 [Vicinamibacterales bacterium]|nr:hypothetical protein [Vicinamibacterales bacterium]